MYLKYDGANDTCSSAALNDEHMGFQLPQQKLTAPGTLPNTHKWNQALGFSVHPHWKKKL